MITFKKGQRVWWDDPVHEKSGEYDVHAVDYAQNIVKIGNGEETVELPSEQLEITCPVSEEDRLQLDKLEQHYHMLGKDALELMRKIVSCFDEGKFSVEGYSVRGCDEDHSPCCVCGFAVDNEELYVELEYESGGVRMVPARDLYTEALFEAFCKLVGKI